jgi:hypothetical protein
MSDHIWSLCARPWVWANTATAKAAAAAEVDDPGAMRVSHGALVKQRRDRINAMMDELRVIVPSAAAVVRAQVGVQGSGFII